MNSLNPPDAARSVICFGVGEGWPSGSRRHASFLYQFGETKLLVDCGDGMSGTFKAAGVPYDAVDAVFLSHMHSDHVGGFSMFVQALWLQKRRRPLPVFAAPLAIMALQAWLAATLLPPELIGFEIQWTPLTAAGRFAVGDVRVTAHPTTHLDSLRQSFGARYPGTSFEAFSFVLEGDDRRVAHTADLGGPTDLVPLLAVRPDLLVCELSHVDPEPLCALLRLTPPGRIVFVHVAREHLQAPERTSRWLQEQLGSMPFALARDGDVFRF